jgi:hypothetical protein
MYVGHVGIALALRAQRDAPPLWLIVLAAQAPDWGDAIFGGLHFHPDPAYGPHGLILVAAGAIATASVAAILARRSGGAAWRWATITCGAYLTHWAVDWLTGRKPTWPGGPTVGLSWYSFPWLDFGMETAMIVFGWSLWCLSLPVDRRRRTTGAPLTWALLAALVGLQLAADLVMSGGITLE